MIIIYAPRAFRNPYYFSCVFLLQEIDIDKEEILLSRSENDLPIENLPSAVPSDQARYHFFLFKHTHEGDYMEKIG